MTTSEPLITLIENMGWSHAEAARIFGVSPSSISTYASSLMMPAHWEWVVAGYLARNAPKGPARKVLVAFGPADKIDTLHGVATAMMIECEFVEGN